MTLAIAARSIWKSAELLIAFHKDKDNEPRETPFFWNPKGGKARLSARPEDQEAVIVLAGENDCADVQIKVHPDKMVVRRETPNGWSGIIIDDHLVRVKAGETWVVINPDGSVAVENSTGKTYVEGNGSIIKIQPDAKIIVSADGGRMSRQTDGKIDIFTEDGFLSRKK